MSVPPPSVRKADRSVRLVSTMIVIVSVVLGINFAISEISRFRVEAAKRLNRETMIAVSTLLLQGDDPAGVAALLKRLPPEEVTRRPVLERAVSFNRPETVRFLLDNQFSPEGRNETGTPLRTAASIGSTPVVKLLLDHGAQPDKKSAEGWNALHWAASGGQTEVVRILLDRGAPINEGTNAPPSLGEDAGPFLGSLANGPVPASAIPLDSLQRAPLGPPIEDAFREKDVTPLMLAAGHGHRETVSLLVTRGADTKRRSASGKTARDFAVKMGHPEVVQLLTKAEKTIRQAAK